MSGGDSQRRSASRDVLGTYQLQVHPSVVFKLGADLVTDDMQALVELIKNAYDADATRVRVTIESQSTIELDSADLEGTDAKLQRYRGRITISDDGDGMSLGTIQKGWLTVSVSGKRLLKDRGEVTSRGRTPLGDKGLGRLGAQRLGDVLAMTTRTESDASAGKPATRVVIPWDLFAHAATLSAVPIRVRSVSPPRGFRRGTSLDIVGLRQPEFWRQGNTAELQREMAAMMSPYEGVSNFSLTLTVDGVKVDLREAAKKVLTAAPVTYKFSFDGQTLQVSSAFSTAFLRPPQGKDDIANYEDLILSDNGFAFSDWLFSNKSRASLGLEPGDDRHFLHSSYSLRFADLQDAESVNGEAVNPGPFHGEVSGIPLARGTTGIFDHASEYREFVRALVGIKVYRDGFGVRVDDDWLRLREKWTSGASFYSLRPGNVTGYVSITARDNAALEETTNREAFKDTPAYRNFFRLLTDWVDYTGRVQEYIRRRYNDYKRVRLAETANVVQRVTKDQLVRHVNERIEQSEALTRRATEASRSIRSIQDSTARLNQQRRASSESIFQDPVLQQAIESAVSEVNEAAVQADESIRATSELHAELDRALAGLRLLDEQLEAAQIQIADAWESVALGLSAEAFAHEVQNIGEGLKARSLQITNYLRRVEHRDQRVWTYVEHVRSSASSLSKQVARLDPSLRYVRERQSVVEVARAISSIFAYHEERLGQKSVIKFSLQVIDAFQVRINEGRLAQVFDNLILNSDYWLRQCVANEERQAGVISATVASPYIIFEDDGWGIDESVEDLIFDPFITLKPAQQGRGLGLFVVRQLLDAAGAEITLMPDRNYRGRRFRFRINFSGAIVR